MPKVKAITSYLGSFFLTHLDESLVVQLVKGYRKRTRTTFLNVRPPCIATPVDSVDIFASQVLINNLCGDSSTSKASDPFRFGRIFDNIINLHWGNICIPGSNNGVCQFFSCFLIISLWQRNLRSTNAGCHPNEALKYRAS